MRPTLAAPLQYTGWRRLLLAFGVTLIGVFHAPATLAQTDVLTTAKQLPAAYRPVGIPDSYVITPAGYFDPSCVQLVHKGEELRGDGQIRKADGSVRGVAPCKNSHFTRTGTEIPASASAVPTPGAAPLPTTARGDTSPGIAHAYVEAATWVAPNSTVRRMTAQWSVPANPSQVSNAVVFFFPGLEDINNTRSILQPVLGYNAYSDSSGNALHKWTIASWNCCIAGNTSATDSITTYPGNVIYGEMVANCPVGQTCTHWNVTTTDLTNNTSAVLTNSDTLDQNFNWVFGIAMEVYSITNCRQYPRDGSMHISDVKLYDVNDQPITPTWGDSGSPSGLTPSCLYHVDSSAPDTIYLSY